MSSPAPVQKGDLSLKEVQKKKPDEKSDIDILIVGVEFKGNTIFSDQELRSPWQRFLNKTSKLDEILAVVAELTAKYRNEGYFLSTIVPLAVKSGGGFKIQLVVVEGYIDRVILEPIRDGFFLGPDRERILAYAERIKASRPLHIDDLERGLLLIRDMPGVSVKSVLRPSAKTAGAADLHLLIEHDEFSARLSKNNRGSKTLGRYRVQGSVSLRSWTGRSEETSLGVSTLLPAQDGAGSLGHLQVSHKELIGNNGLSFTSQASYLRSEEGGVLTPLGVEGTAGLVSARLDFPFLRNRKQTLRGHIEGRYQTQKSRLMGETITHDTIWSVRAGASYEKRSNGRIAGAFLAISKGFDVFDNTERNSSQASRTGGWSDFAKIEGGARIDQALWGGLIGRLTIDAQYSPTRLLALEEFYLGGSRYGRAYQASSLSGDSGFAASIELSKTFPLLDPVSIQPYAYIDGGRVWNHDPSGNNSLFSTGAGVRTIFGEKGWFDLSLNVPLSGHDLDDREEAPRLYFSAAVTF
ncbi:ShlB/FhaC/HecB family hemolysin secretion/activation protein [Roseibium sp. SCP14]|uniref:ShlB/FhaC/HecB family hemolysin secretion/activation protein n=1 Tax=Roseibium sp. SCP14 TaxID=3141375 RepID=UPI00333B8F10